jgi:hypothetical protein
MQHTKNIARMKLVCDLDKAMIILATPKSRLTGGEAYGQSAAF